MIVNFVVNYRQFEDYFLKHKYGIFDAYKNN